MGKDEVEKLVESVYNGNWLKNVAASVIALSIVLAVCIAVARLDDPFPYDGMAWFVPVYYLGRVLERPGLLILCMLLAVTVGSVAAIIGTSANFKQISNLLDRQCDASAHMYALECMLAVRGDLKRMDQRRSVFNMAENEYAMRLVKYGRLEEARDYLNTRWSQKRSAWAYRRTEHMLELAEAYRDGDTQRYDAAAAKLPWADRHDRYFPLWRMLMTQEYEKTLKLLEGARAASPAWATCSARRSCTAPLRRTGTPCPWRKKPANGCKSAAFPPRRRSLQTRAENLPGFEKTGEIFLRLLILLATLIRYTICEAVRKWSARTRS